MGIVSIVPPSLLRDAPVRLLVRPHDIELFLFRGAPCKWRQMDRFPGVVRDVEYGGSILTVEVAIANTASFGDRKDDEETIIAVDVEHESKITAGQMVEIGIPYHRVTVVASENSTDSYL